MEVTKDFQKAEDKLRGTLKVLKVTISTCCSQVLFQMEIVKREYYNYLLICSHQSKSKK